MTPVCAGCTTDCRCAHALSTYGHCCGHVDFGELGELGVADRWADLVVATLSLGWNYPGRVWDAEFFAAYGIEADAARIDYYRRLWQAEDTASR